MGIAVFNIGGQTICSAFHKKMYQTNQIMSADELNTFRIKYRHVKVVIIDEISMVATRTLNFIDTRLQQLTRTRAPFGGLSIIAVGDLYQLKPVGDKPVFLTLDEDAKALAPNLCVDHFKMYELVDILRQKDNLKFAKLLNRLRLNEISADYKNELRNLLLAVIWVISDAVHLFAEKAGVYEHNENIMNHMEVEKVIIPCHVVFANIFTKKGTGAY